jgi:hypothetical protein
MLQNSQYKNGDIVAFKLSNGEEIVAKLVDSDMSTYTLSKPVTIAPSQQGLQFMQGFFTANQDKHVILYKSAVVMTAEPVEEVQKSYTEATTGIALAK